MDTARQLLLPFPDEPGYNAADFIAAPSNQVAMAWLTRVPDWPDRRLAIWGAAGSGKTHLLRIWCAQTGAEAHAGPTLRGLPTALTDAGLAIDDADAVPDETTLLHWLNTARDFQVPVLITSRTPPSRWQIRLPDLASRLRAILAVGIEPPGDALLSALLAHLLSDRQWRLDSRAQDRLLPLLPRSPGGLREAVARLDHVLMTTGGRLTQKLIEAVVTEMSTNDREPAGEMGASVEYHAPVPTTAQRP